MTINLSLKDLKIIVTQKLEDNHTTVKDKILTTHIFRYCKKYKLDYITTKELDHFVDYIINEIHKKSCFGKSRFPCKKDAHKKAKEFSMFYKIKYREYECKCCGLWHLTTKNV